MYHCAVLFFQHTHIILVHPYIHTTYTHVSTQKETKCLLIKYWHKGFTGPPPPPPLQPPPASSNTSVLMDGDCVYICMRMPTCVCVRVYVSLGAGHFLLQWSLPTHCSYVTITNTTPPTGTAVLTYLLFGPDKGTKWGSWKSAFFFFLRFVFFLPLFVSLYNRAI